MEEGDEFDVETAYHEAGHAIAAALCGEQWTGVFVFSGGQGYTGIIPRAATHPANRAFIAWAGCWAEVRSALGFGNVSEDDYWLLRWSQQHGGSDDMRKIQQYWDDSSLGPHETEEHWDAELELAWPQIRQLAERLAVSGCVCVRDDEHIWSNLAELGLLDHIWPPPSRT